MCGGRASGALRLDHDAETDEGARLERVDSVGGLAPIGEDHPAATGLTMRRHSVSQRVHHGSKYRPPLLLPSNRGYARLALLGKYLVGSDLRRGSAPLRAWKGAARWPDHSTPEPALDAGDNPKSPARGEVPATAAADGARCLQVLQQGEESVDERLVLSSSGNVANCLCERDE